MLSKSPGVHHHLIAEGEWRRHLRNLLLVATGDNSLQNAYQIVNDRQKNVMAQQNALPYVVHLRQFEQDSRFHPRDRRDQCPGSLIPQRFQLRGDAGMTPHHSTTRLKFGTVGNSFQRSPRLGKLLEVAAFLQVQLFSISRFSNIKQKT